MPAQPGAGVNVVNETELRAVGSCVVVGNQSLMVRANADELAAQVASATNEPLDSFTTLTPLPGSH